MKRIAFRRILPIVQIVLFGVLIWLGKEQEKAAYAEWDARESGLSERARQQQEAEAEAKGQVLFDPRKMWDGYTPPAWELCMAINAPVILVALSLVVWSPVLSGSEWVTFWVCAVAVGIFWFLVGRYLDRLIWPLQQPPSQIRRRATFVRWFLLLAFLGIAVACSVALASFHSHSEWRLWSLVIWSTFAAMVQALKLARRQKLSAAQN